MATNDAGKARPRVPREYYKLAEAAKILGCTQADLLHLGATRKTVLKTRLRMWQTLVPIRDERPENAKHLVGLGTKSKGQLVTVLPKYLQRIEMDGFCVLESAPFPQSENRSGKADSPVPMGRLMGLIQDPRSGVYVGPKFERKHLFILHRDLQCVREVMADRQADIRPLGHVQKRTHVRIIAALAKTLAASARAKYGTQDRPNVAAIANAVAAAFEGKSIRGISQKNVEKHIAEGLKSLEQE